MILAFLKGDAGLSVRFVSPSRSKKEERPEERCCEKRVEPVGHIAVASISAKAQLMYAGAMRGDRGQRKDESQEQGSEGSSDYRATPDRTAEAGARVKRYQGANNDEEPRHNIGIVGHCGGT